MREEKLGSKMSECEWVRTGGGIERPRRIVNDGKKTTKKAYEWVWETAWYIQKEPVWQKKKKKRERINEEFEIVSVFSKWGIAKKFACFLE